MGFRLIPFTGNYLYIAFLLGIKFGNAVVAADQLIEQMTAIFGLLTFKACNICVDSMIAAESQAKEISLD